MSPSRRCFTGRSCQVSNDISNRQLRRPRRQPEPASSRRKFLKGAAVAAAGADARRWRRPTSRARRPSTLKMQGAWGATDIFNDMAMQYVDRVNKMAGGRLQIDYLVAGAVVKPFSVMDAVHEGVLDAGHHVTVYWYGKNKAASLFGTGPYLRLERGAGPRLDPPRRRQGALRRADQRHPRPQRGRLLRHADADPAARLVQGASSRARTTCRG